MADESESRQNAIRHLGSVISYYRFYEKVLNVKADVAAILNSFFPVAIVSDSIRPSAAANARFADASGSRTADALTVEDRLFEISRLHPLVPRFYSHSE